MSCSVMTASRRCLKHVAFGVLGSFLWSSLDRDDYWGVAENTLAMTAAGISSLSLMAMEVSMLYGPPPVLDPSVFDGQILTNV